MRNNQRRRTRTRRRCIDAVTDTITGHAVIMSRRMGGDVSGMDNLNAYADRLEAREAFQRAEAA